MYFGVILQKNILLFADEYALVQSQYVLVQESAQKPDDWSYITPTYASSEKSEQLSKFL